MLWQQIFCHFGIDDFPFRIPYTKRFGGEIRFRSCQIAAICGAVVQNSLVLRNSVSADRSGMAASRFVTAAAASVILLCFASQSRKSHCIVAA